MEQGRLLHRLDAVVSGPANRWKTVPLAAVLALQTADSAAVGADATALQHGLGISETQIGLLLGVAVIVGALMTVPAGMLADRVNRTKLLAWTVGSWGVAMLLSAAAPDFTWLLAARTALGGVTAAGGPITASLIGDYFAPQERGAIYSNVLCGEVVGAGFGLVIAGELALLSWRAPFIVLAVPTVLVCWLVARMPEPARNAQRVTDPSDDQDGRALERLSLWGALRYVLGIRTNLVLIGASALGFFFTAGLRGFAVQFAQQHYGISHTTAIGVVVALGIGALVGVAGGGRWADRLTRHGRPAARIEIPGAAVLISVVLIVPGLLATSVWAALPLLVIAAACLGATTSPLDAARLDIVNPAVWGRAEAVRTILRDGGEAVGPVLLGFLADTAFRGTDGLRDALLVSLAALAAEGAILLGVGRRTYPGDVEHRR